jgi:hypothetical protein
MRARFLIPIVAVFVLAGGRAWADDSTPTGYDSLDEAGQIQAEDENPLLRDILYKAKDVQDFAADCKGKKCPKIDCDEAAELLGHLRRLEFLLRAEIYYAGLAKEQELQHFKDLSNESIITGDNLSRAEWALGVQKFWHDFSKSMADIASIADTFRSFSQKGLGENWGDTLEQLDSLEQRLRTVDSLTTRLAQGHGAEGAKDIYKPYVTPPIEGFDTIRSATVDVAKAIRKYKKEMKDSGVWDTLKDLKVHKKLFNPSTVTGGDAKKFFDVKEGLRKNLASWAQKILAAYDSKLMKEREGRIDDMVNQLSASDRTAGQAFLDYQKAVRKLEVAEEAMKQVKAAMKALEECMDKAECVVSIPPFGPGLPDFGNSWGTAFKEIEKQLQGVLDSMTIPTVTEDCPPKEQTGLFLGTPYEIFITTDSTLWCHFRPDTPVPIPLPPYTGGPITLGPPPETPGGGTPPETPGGPPPPPVGPSTPLWPFPPGTPTFPGGPITTPPEGPMIPIPTLPIPGGHTFFPGAPSDGPITVTPIPVPPEGGTTTKPPEKKQPPPTHVTIYVNVKASEESIKRGETGSQLPTQLIKVVPQSTVNPALPGVAKKDSDTGHDKDPMQTTADKDHPGVIDLPLGGGGATGPGTGEMPSKYSVDLPIDTEMTSMSLTGPGLVAPPVVDGYSPAELDTVGGQNFYIYYLPGSVAQNAIATNSDPNIIIEINICFTKEPLPPGRPLGDPARARDQLPSATLHLAQASGSAQ